MKAKTINETKNRTLAIDFDGVIHSYKQEWTGQTPEDPPMEGVEEGLEILKKNGWNLVILSTRYEDEIWDWLEKYDLQHYFDDVTNEKIPAKLYIDDRGYHFENWKDTIEFIENFKDRYE